MVMVTSTQVTIVIQKMRRKIASIEGPKVEMSCGKYIFSSIVKSHPYRAGGCIVDSRSESCNVIPAIRQPIIYELKFPAIVRLRVRIRK